MTTVVKHVCVMREQKPLCEESTHDHLVGTIFARSKFVILLGNF